MVAVQAEDVRISFLCFVSTTTKRHGVAASIAENPVEIFNVHLFLLFERFVPTKVTCVDNKHKPWFNDDCRRAFDLRQGAHLRLTRDHSRLNWDGFVWSLSEED